MEDNNLRRELQELKLKYKELMGLYVETKKAVIDSTWSIVEFAPQLFAEIKPVDSGLVETERRVGEYNIQEVLGVGQFSVVKAITKGMTKPMYSGVPRRRRRDGDGTPLMAVKIVRKDDTITIQSILAVESEICILKEVGPHRNVVKFMETLHGPRHLYIIMERMKRDLFNFMEENKSKMDANITGLITKEILSGVAHLTQHRVVHRDIKPENVLIDVTTNNIVVKLCDFGHSRQLSKGETTLTNDFAGSPGFYAPEAVVTATYDAFKADVYSVLCVTLEMLVSVDFFSNVWMAPFYLIKHGGSAGVDEKHDFYLEMRKSMLAAHEEVRELYGAPGEGVISEFVCGVIHMQPELRPSVISLLSAEWLSRVDKASACDKLLDREHLHLQYRRFSYLPSDPSKRISGLTMHTTAASNLPVLDRGVKVPENRLERSAASPSTASSPTLPAFDNGESRRRSGVHLRDNGLGMMNVNSVELARQAAERRQSFLTCQVESASFRGAYAAAHQAKYELAIAANKAEALVKSVLANPPYIETNGGRGEGERIDDRQVSMQQVPFGGNEKEVLSASVDETDSLQFFMEEDALTDKEDVSPPLSRVPSRAA